MPKSTAFLVDDFIDRIEEARGLAESVERSSEFLYNKRLHVYEAAYLLAFSGWENLLEQSFLRYLCGYVHSSGPLTTTTTWSRPPSLPAALTLVLNGKPHKLWHNPDHVVRRSAGYFVMGPHESVLGSALADLQDFAAIRHYVAHRNADTKAKFETAARRLSGAGVLGTRAGRFLRSETIDAVSGSSVNWLERICLDLSRYARQVAG